MRLTALVLAGSVVTGSHPLLAQVVTREATPISASASRTWDAVADAFASRAIPIRTMERASGLIVTDAVDVEERQATRWAKRCGMTEFSTDIPLPIVPVFPDRAAYKVLVRGDSATSTVSVTVRWTHGGVPEDPQVVECRTKDVRERELEAAIKLGAETVVARDATPVNASVGRAWDAVLDLFAARQIAISTWERASGFIGTDQWDVPGSEARRWADCGKFLGMSYEARRATYNVFVRGDSTASTVMVTVRWVEGFAADDPPDHECKTRNVLESELEAAIKLRAETH